MCSNAIFATFQVIPVISLILFILAFSSLSPVMHLHFATCFNATLVAYQVIPVVPFTLFLCPLFSLLLFSIVLSPFTMDCFFMRRIKSFPHFSRCLPLPPLILVFVFFLFSQGFAFYWHAFQIACVALSTYLCITHVFTLILFILHLSSFLLSVLPSLPCSMLEIENAFMWDCKRWHLTLKTLTFEAENTYA